MEISRSVLGIVWIFISFMPNTHANSGMSAEQYPEPNFAAPIENITIPVGKEAVLTCAVQNLRGFKVGWMRASDHTVIALQGRVVTHNPRFSVSQEDMHIWKLKIKQLRETDRGCYMCQINANPMKKQIGCIDVQVPPDISDEESSRDITVKEGENTSLYCNGRGHPIPRILWRREDGGPITLVNSPTNVTKVESFIGSLLQLTKVQRKQMGAYLCIAVNDVPPAVSKRVYLNVHFPPLIMTSKPLIGSVEGNNVNIECLVEAFPYSVNYWMKEIPSFNKFNKDSIIDYYNKPEMVLNSEKYHIREEKLSQYEINLILTINDFMRSDVGIYTCIANNFMARANQTIRVYEIKVTTQTPPSSSTSRTMIKTKITTTPPVTTTITSTTKIPTTVVATTSTTTTTTKRPIYTTAMKTTPMQTTIFLTPIDRTTTEQLIFYPHNEGKHSSSSNGGSGGSSSNSGSSSSASSSSSSSNSNSNNDNNRDTQINQPLSEITFSSSQIKITFSFIYFSMTALIIQ